MLENLDPEFWQSVEEFNQHEFYACHDTLEAIWMEAIEPQRTFYQGVLQLAVALYHLSNHNWRGAVILLGEGLMRLRPYEPDYGTVDVEDLIDQAQDLLDHLQTTGAEQVQATWEELQQGKVAFPKVRMRDEGRKGVGSGEWGNS